MPEPTPDPWQAVDVRSWISSASKARRAGAQDEPLGSKEKFWLTDPSGVSWLFKYARTGGVDNWVSGEDWAEVAVAELAVLIGVPTASVRLGMLDDCRGVLSRNLVPRGCKLEHGNELLSAIDPQYADGRSGENERYTVAASAACLRTVAPPAGSLVAELTAVDVWAGYLVLDAWLAGTDRHDENWGAILDQNGRRHLAPSFDHGNALGFQVRPEEHERLANDERALRAWASRGRCRYFAGRPGLTELAHDALDRATVVGRRHWLERLADATPDRVESVLVKVPRGLMSDSTRMFCTRMTAINRRRLLDGT